MCKLDFSCLQFENFLLISSTFKTKSYKLFGSSKLSNESIPHTNQVTGAQALVRMLQAYKVEKIFGFAGIHPFHYMTRCFSLGLT